MDRHPDAPVTDLADHRIREAARERSRAGERRRMRDDELDLVGLLMRTVDGEPVGLGLSDGSALTGSLRRVTRTGVVGESDRGRWLVPTSEIVLVRRVTSLDGRPSYPVEDTPISALASTAFDIGDELHVRTAGHDVSGLLRAIGTDVLAIRTVDGSTVHVAMDRIVVASWVASDDVPMRHDARNASTSDRMRRITRPNR